MSEFISLARRTKSLIRPFWLQKKAHQQNRRPLTDVRRPSDQIERSIVLPGLQKTKSSWGSLTDTHDRLERSSTTLRWLQAYRRVVYKINTKYQYKSSQLFYVLTLFLISVRYNVCLHVKSNTYMFPSTLRRRLIDTYRPSLNIDQPLHDNEVHNKMLIHQI